MKKVLFLLAAIVAFSFNAFADVDPYTVDDNAIDQLFAQATEVSIDEIDAVLTGSQILMPGMENQASIAAKSSVSPWAAWAICWFVGGFGIHRHYMGTKGSMWAIYTFTCGGIFGIVTFVDWVVLLVGAIKDDIRDYCNNDRFFMWL